MFWLFCFLCLHALCCRLESLPKKDWNGRHVENNFLPRLVVGSKRWFILLSLVFFIHNVSSRAIKVGRAKKTELHWGTIISRFNFEGKFQKIAYFYHGMWGRRTPILLEYFNRGPYSWIDVSDKGDSRESSRKLSLVQVHIEAILSPHEKSGLCRKSSTEGISSKYVLTVKHVIIACSVMQITLPILPFFGQFRVAGGCVLNWDIMVYLKVRSTIRNSSFWLMLWWTEGPCCVCKRGLGKAKGDGEGSWSGIREKMLLL